MYEMDEFVRFEEKYNVYDKKIKGYYYWNIIRFYLSTKMIEYKKDLGKAHTGLDQYTPKELFGKLILQIPDLIFKNPLWFLRKKDILILNHARRVKENGKYSCIYTDLLADTLKNTYMVLESSMLLAHKKPVQTKHIRYLDYIDRKKNLLMLGSRKYRLSAEETDELTEVVNHVNAYFQIGLDREETVRELANRIITHQIYDKYFTKILKKVRPKIIIEVVYYSSVCLAFNEAAKKLNITTIELQHGAVGLVDCLYNYYKKALIPSFPDYVFLFGEYWRKNMRFPIADANVKAVGWPFYEKRVKSYAKGKKKNEYTTILFISQGPVGEKLSKAAVTVADQLDPGQYRIIYKLHPGEYARWKKEYPWMVDAKLTVIDNNEADMHHYFSQSDIQAGVFSTAIYEGLGYGLRTFIWNLPGSETMQPLLDAGIASLADGAEDFIRSIAAKNKSAENFDATAIWKENSLHNILQEIDNLLRKH